MDCTQTKNGLVAYLSGDLSSTEGKILLTHLSTCKTCSADNQALEKIWVELGVLPALEVPWELHNATLSSVEKMLREGTAHITTEPGSKKWLWKALIAALGAITLAFFALGALRGVAQFDQLSDETIFLCASLFTGLLTVTFLFATGSLPGISMSWQSGSRIALSGLAFVIVGTLLCPKMNLIHWWETLPPGRALLNYGEAISHGSFGLLYTFIPLFLAVCVLGKRANKNLLRPTFYGSALFFVLLLPAIVLQAFPLSSIVFLHWAVGSLLGVTTAALSGASFVRLTTSIQNAHA